MQPSQSFSLYVFIPLVREIINVGFDYNAITNRCQVVNHS